MQRSEASDGRVAGLRICWYYLLSPNGWFYWCMISLCWNSTGGGHCRPVACRCRLRPRSALALDKDDGEEAAVEGLSCSAVVP